MSGTKNSNAIPDYEVIFTEEAQKNGSGLGILKKIFKNNIFKFIVSTFLFIIKHLPVIFIPLITANIINIATSGKADTILTEFAKRIFDGRLKPVLDARIAAKK